MRSPLLRRHHVPLLSAAVFAMWGAIACADGPSRLLSPVAPCSAALGAGVTATDSAGLSAWAILPRSTDACVTLAPDSHFVYRAPGVSQMGRLFVFLPGTGATARAYRLILSQAARNGYHAIGVTYPNDGAVATLCAGAPGACYGDARLEIVTGQPSSAVVTVDRANSIENRIVRLLEFMRATEPGGNWGQFLIGDTAVAWSKVSVAGHSQGGGHALFIAQRHAVLRATAYASFGDALPNGTSVAPWVTRPYATPKAQIFGLVSTFDETMSPTFALAAWSAIGMGPLLVDVDITAMPYGAAQRFITAAFPINARINATPNHNVIALDINTPRFASSVPAFAGVWRALSFPP
jgi:hypothetical protein